MIQLRYLISAFTFFYIFGFSVAFAEPSITNVLGNIFHKGVIVIEGSSFGFKSPASPLIWDDCESRTINSPSAVESEGGWTDAKPVGTVWARTEEDSNYFEIQYRPSGFRGVSTPHSNSSTFLAGSHSLYKEYNPNASYDWIASGSGTNEYYLADASIPQSGNYLPNKVRFGTTLESARWGTIGSLTDHQVGWGDNDGLGYNTIYFRDNSGDPDVTDIPIYVGCYIISATYNVGVKIYTGGTSYDTWFVSYYHVLDPDWPQETYGRRSNHKLINMDHGCTNQILFCGSPQYYFSHPYGGQPANGGTHVGMAANNGHCGDDTNPFPEGTKFPNYIYTQQSDWQQWQFEFDYQDNDDIRRAKVDGAVVNLADGCDITETFDGVSLGIYFCYEDGYWYDNGIERAISCMTSQEYRDTHINTFRYFDDIYIDNTLSRVMIGNNSTLSSCTILEPQIPSEWSDTSIKVTINQGALLSCKKHYLFVFDANNNHNAVGYPVSVCTSAGKAPCPPTGLKVVQ